MALTAEQEAEVITRLEAGEGPGKIIQGMSIERTDYMAFRTTNKRAVVNAQKKKTARLARLNSTKANLEGAKVVIEEKIAALTEQIAEVEAEEE